MAFTLMKIIRHILILATLSAVAFAAEPSATPVVTLQDEVELYGAITSLDRGATKVIDGKPQGVPFTFSASVRFALALDASMVKQKAEAYQNAANATRARLDPKGAPDHASENSITQAILAELQPVFAKADPLPPALQKISLADLNLDANPIPLDTLTKLRLIIQQ